MFGELARTFPLIHRYTEELGRESVQISIWLVGLAAALMGFIATMPRAIALMPHWQAVAVACALALVVLLGLTHRVFYGSSLISVGKNRRGDSAIPSSRSFC
jgi:hypothetical protein